LNAQVDPDEPTAPSPPTTVPRAPSRYDLPDGVESIEDDSRKMPSKFRDKPASSLFDTN
jgi:hypothetical protein